MKLKTLIVEDEAISREALADMVSDVPWLDYVGAAGGVSDAVKVARTHLPDVLFLDVKIPGGSGFDVLRLAPFIPNVIFTTAHRDFAVDAFEINAVDYLLKPFSKRRFDAAMKKLQMKTSPPEVSLQREQPFMVRVGKRLYPMQLDDIDYFRAEGDYVAACGPNLNRLISTSLSALETELDPRSFVRIHRSLIVNLKHVRFLQAEGDRQLRLLMRDGSELLSSRAGTKRLEAFVRK